MIKKINVWLETEEISPSLSEVSSLIKIQQTEREISLQKFYRKWGYKMTYNYKSQLGPSDSAPTQQQFSAFQFHYQPLLFIKGLNNAIQLFLSCCCFPAFGVCRCPDAPYYSSRISVIKQRLSFLLEFAAFIN